VYLKEYVEEDSVNSDDFIVNFINKVLETLEILLHNESYRNYIEQSPEMIDHIILLFEKLKSNESRVLVLRMVS